MNVNINYIISQVEKITAGKLINYNADLPSPVYLSLDSRKIIFPAETIFFAIKTQHNNGNAFIESLYKKGVRNFVSDDKNIDVKNISLANVIVVKNSIQALQMLATHHRDQFMGIPVIGITGSNGKTIVKEWLNQLLSTDYVIVRSPKSYNSQIGVPLSVLNINASHTLAIFEAGISLPGEMKQLEEIIKPGIGVLTNIGHAHDEGFDNILQKINEKLELFVHSKFFIFCADKRQVKKAVGLFQKKIKNKNNDQQLFS